MEQLSRRAFMKRAGGAAAATTAATAGCIQDGDDGFDTSQYDEIALETLINDGLEQHSDEYVAVTGYAKDLGEQRIYEDADNTGEYEETVIDAYDIHSEPDEQSASVFAGMYPTGHMAPVVPASHDEDTVYPEERTLYGQVEQFKNDPDGAVDHFFEVHRFE